MSEATAVPSSSLRTASLAFTRFMNPSRRRSTKRFHAPTTERQAYADELPDLPSSAAVTDRWRGDDHAGRAHPDGAGQPRKSQLRGLRQRALGRDALGLDPKAQRIAG